MWLMLRRGSRGVTVLGLQAVAGSEQQRLLVWRSSCSWIPCRSWSKEKYAGRRSPYSGWVGGRQMLTSGLYANPWIPYPSLQLFLRDLKNQPGGAISFSLSCCLSKVSSVLFPQLSSPSNRRTRANTLIWSTLEKAGCAYKISAIFWEVGFIYFELYSQISKDIEYKKDNFWKR